eukprot:scaffold932_cov328-Pavlova_lutheri.AAC.36
MLTRACGRASHARIAEMLGAGPVAVSCHVDAGFHDVDERQFDPDLQHHHHVHEHIHAIEVDLRIRQDVPTVSGRQGGRGGSTPPVLPASLRRDADGPVEAQQARSASHARLGLDRCASTASRAPVFHRRLRRVTSNPPGQNKLPGGLPLPLPPFLPSGTVSGSIRFGRGTWTSRGARSTSTTRAEPHLAIGRCASRRVGRSHVGPAGGTRVAGGAGRRAPVEKEADPRERDRKCWEAKAPSTCAWKNKTWPSRTGSRSCPGTSPWKSKGRKEEPSWRCSSTKPKSKDP